MSINPLAVQSITHTKEMHILEGYGVESFTCDSLVDVTKLEQKLKTQNEEIEQLKSQIRSIEVSTVNPLKKLHALEVELANVKRISHLRERSLKENVSKMNAKVSLHMFIHGVQSLLVFFMVALYLFKYYYVTSVSTVKTRKKNRLSYNNT